MRSSLVRTVGKNLTYMTEISSRIAPAHPAAPRAPYAPLSVTRVPIARHNDPEKAPFPGSPRLYTRGTRVGRAVTERV